MPFLIPPSPTASEQRRKTFSVKPQISYKKLTMGLQSYKDIKQAHLKNRACQDSQQYKQNQQCTFQPQLISSAKKKSSESKRSLKKFLEDQQKFTNDKKRKIEKLREQFAKTQVDEFKGKPSIDSTSHRISTQMSTQQVFDRLSKQKKMLHQVQIEQMFSPKICTKSKSLKREKNVANLLYEDAIRRRQKQSLNFTDLLKKQFVPTINSNTNDLVIKKFYSQFTQMVLEDEISPLLAITVLSQIFNVDLNPNKSSEQEKICEKVLYYIADTKTEMVNAEILWNFIQTIVNGHLVNSNFSEEEQDQILQHFGHFYSQRLTKPRKNITPEKCAFKPKTLRSSQKLAQNHRQRTLSNVNQYLQNQKVKIEIVNNSVKIEDLFIIEHMKKNAQNSKKKLQKQNEQVSRCSFKPDLRLSTKTKQQNHFKKINVIVPRSTKAQQLQKRFKIKKTEEQVANKQNSERLRTMYQQSIKQKSQNSTMRKGKESKRAEVKNIEKSIIRVTLARKNRESKNALQERGYPSNVENWQNFRKSLKKDIEKSSEGLLKGYYSLQKSASTILKSSSILSKHN